MHLFATIAVALVLTTATLSTELDGEWQAFKTTYNKVYSSDEEAMRRTIWEDNLRYINNHNQEAARGQHSFTLGMNKYGDKTVNELMYGYKMTNTTRTAGSAFLSPSNTKLPDAVDWRKHGYVTPVMDQDFILCGSCWAFSATGSLEGQHFKKTGKLVSLSEQNLVDCSWKEGNKGCGGGWQDQAFRYIQINNGIDTEASYPYQAKDGKCRFNASETGATVRGFYDIQSKNETALQVAVATVGPISIAIDAVHLAFLFYKSGVYYESTCRENYLSHAMLIVGYGVDNGKDFWLVKNSMGTDWGMGGYIMMSRNRDNNCGIATHPSYPLV